MSSKTKEVFGDNKEGVFELPYEITVYVPSTQDVDKVISLDEMETRGREVSRYLAELFGGYTGTETVGGFVASNGDLVNEEIMKVTSFSEKDAFTKHKKKLLKKIGDWGTEWGQEAIGFEYEGDLFYVPQDYPNSKEKMVDGGGISIATMIGDHDLSKHYEGITKSSKLYDNKEIYVANNKNIFDSVRGDLKDRYGIKSNPYRKDMPLYFTVENEQFVGRTTEGGVVDLVHVYDEDGSMYGTGELVEVKGKKSVVRFDAETVKEFDSERVKAIMKQGGQTEAQSHKIAVVMGEFKDGSLKSSSGDLVTDRKQAIAIALSEAGVPKKLYEGGNVENYDKWKSINWDSMPDGKNRSKIYRLLGWIADERIDLSKLKESTREDIEEYTEEALSRETFSSIIRDEISALEKDYELMMRHESPDDEKALKKALDSDEYKDLKERMSKYNVTVTDLETKGIDDISDEYAAEKDYSFLVDFFILTDEGWSELNYISDKEAMTNTYEEALSSGAVFTEESELEQHDLFEEREITEQTLDTEDELSDLKNEIDALEELRTVVGDDKELVNDINTELEALNSLLEIMGGENYKEGGIIIDENNISIVSDDKYLPKHLSFYYTDDNGKRKEIGYANTELYISDLEVLSLQEYIIYEPYRNAKVDEAVLSEIKRILPKSKKKILVNNSIH